MNTTIASAAALSPDRNKKRSNRLKDTEPTAASYRSLTRRVQ